MRSPSIVKIVIVHRDGRLLNFNCRIGSRREAPNSSSYSELTMYGFGTTLIRSSPDAMTAASSPAAVVWKA